VPTFEVEGRLFWGLDALPMLRAALLGEPWFDGPAWDAAALARPGCAADARQPCQPLARRARISNAGSVLPSSTSRKAPPPVEM
jgi:hypothetical protein